MSSTAQIPTGSGVTTRSHKRAREEADRPATGIPNPKRRRSTKPALPSFPRRSPRHTSANNSNSQDLHPARAIPSPRTPVRSRTAHDTDVSSESGGTISVIVKGKVVPAIDLTDPPSKRKRSLPESKNEDESRLQRPKRAQEQDSTTQSQSDSPRTLRAQRRATRRRTPSPVADEETSDEDITLVNPPSDPLSGDSTDCDDSPLTTPEAEEKGWEEGSRKEVSLDTESVELRLTTHNEILVVDDSPQEQWYSTTPGDSVQPQETRASPTSHDDAEVSMEGVVESGDVSGDAQSEPAREEAGEEEQPRTPFPVFTRFGFSTGDGKYTPYEPTSNLAPHPVPRNREPPAHSVLLAPRKDTMCLSKDALRRAAFLAQQRFNPYGMEDLHVPSVAMDPHFVHSPAEVDLYPYQQAGEVSYTTPPTAGYTMQLEPDLDPSLFFDNGLSTTPMQVTSDTSAFSPVPCSSWDGQDLSMQGGHFGYDNGFGQSSNQALYDDVQSSGGLLQSFPLMQPSYTVPFTQSTSLASHQLSLESSLAPMVDYTFADHHSNSQSFLEQDVIERQIEAEQCQAPPESAY